MFHVSEAVRDSLENKANLFASQIDSRTDVPLTIAEKFSSIINDLTIDELDFLAAQQLHGETIRKTELSSDIDSALGESNHYVSTDLWQTLMNQNPPRESRVLYVSEDQVAQQSVAKQSVAHISELLSRNLFRSDCGPLEVYLGSATNKKSTKDQLLIPVDSKAFSGPEAYQAVEQYIPTILAKLTGPCMFYLIQLGWKDNVSPDWAFVFLVHIYLGLNGGGKKTKTQTAEWVSQWVWHALFFWFTLRLRQVQPEDPTIQYMLNFLQGAYKLLVGQTQTTSIIEVKKQLQELDKIRSGFHAIFHSDK